MSAFLYFPAQAGIFESAWIDLRYGKHARLNLFLFNCNADRSLPLSPPRHKTGFAIEHTQTGELEHEMPFLKTGRRNISRPGVASP